jgi:hypothetical protein
MSASVAKLSSLRQLLADRFPQAERSLARRLPTGLPGFDEASGGLPCGAVTEVVCAGPSCGGTLLIGELLRVVREQHGRAALIDGGDGFDPQSWPEEWLEAVVWVRCRDGATALRAADLVTRDANFQLVVLDVRGVGTTELRKTPASFWYRLQRAAEPADLAFVALTPRALVPSAQLRFELTHSYGLDTLNSERGSLAAALAPRLHRQRWMAAAG